MTIGPASGAVVDALDVVLPALGDGATARVATVRDRVAGPFVVALAGRVKAGKSTLINALVGRAIAPTDVGECTRVVTRFRFGPEEKVDVVTRAGQRLAVPLTPEGKLPAELPVPFPEVEHLCVELTTPALYDLELVDTPGLSTVRKENAERTEAFLGLDDDSGSACSEAEALVFLVNQAVRADDAVALRRFVAACGDRTGVATVAVLNKADQVDGGLAAARALAGRQAAALDGLVTAVVPLAGLVAATVRTGAFSDDDADALATLAAMPRPDLDVLLVDLGLFCELDAPVSSEQRLRLARLLALHGIEVALETVREGTRGGAALGRVLLARSGYGQLDGAVASIRRRADALKCRTAVAALEKLAYDRQAPSRDAETLRTAIAELRNHPALHGLDELAVLDDVSIGVVRFDGPELAELDRLFTSAPATVRLGAPPGVPADRLAAIAWDGATRWQVAANAPTSPRQRHAARIVQRSYLLLWEGLNAATCPTRARSH